MPANPLLAAKQLGQSLWLDDMRLELLDGGGLRELIGNDGLAGMTSNPTLFAKDIVERQAYDDAIGRLAGQGLDAVAIYEQLALEDIRRAADQFRPVYEDSGGRDGYVSLEVSPHLAYDTEGTVAEAKRLWGLLDRPNVMIKVPGTPAGLPALRQLIAEGLCVNVTLLFGIDRYRSVAEHYLAGLEDRQAAGQPLDNIASVASFFLSRIDVLVDGLLDSHLNSVGDGRSSARWLRGETAIASARLAYEAFQGIFDGERWQALQRSGARPQRLLWASTSTKDPDYSDVLYVESLIGPHTVNTLPLKTLEAFRDHGRAVNRIGERLDHARGIPPKLAELDIALDQVTARLEREGVDKFAASFDHLLETIDSRRKQVAHG